MARDRMMNSIISVLKRSWCVTLILIGIPLLLSACGGGTSGTGLQTFSGQVKSSTGEPVAGATVTLASTGDTAMTDASGRFVLRSTIKLETSERIELLLESSQFSGRVVVPEGAVTEGSAQITVDIVFDPDTQTLEITNFTLAVRMVGACQGAFENAEVIRQLVEVPEDIECSLEVELRGNGILRGNVPVMLQYRVCSGKSGVWQNLRGSTTLTGTEVGTARINFDFNNSRKFCRYRVVAPYNYRDYLPAVFEVQTLKEQEALNNLAPPTEAPMGDVAP